MLGKPSSGQKLPVLICKDKQTVKSTLSGAVKYFISAVSKFRGFNENGILVHFNRYIMPPDVKETDVNLQQVFLFFSIQFYMVASIRIGDSTEMPQCIIYGIERKYLKYSAGALFMLY